jgi:hypothetical protein
MVHYELFFCLISLFLYMLLIWLETLTRWNPFFFCLDATDTRNKKMNDANTEKLKGTLKKQK